MGYLKQLQIKIAEGGANPIVVAGKSVCRDCFDEPAIKEFIGNNLDSDTCDFCGASTEGEEDIAADLEVVLDHIVASLRVEYDDPNNEVGWDSGEGGWVGARVYDTDEVFENTGLYVSDRSTDLLDVMIEALGSGRQFCERNPYSLRENVRLLGGWDALAERLKHGSRFFFLRDDDDDDHEYVGASEILDRLAQQVIDLNLVTTISKGTRLFRVRYQKDGEKHKTAEDLGPPPAHLATLSNRMSPPGIVMTYLAEDQDTALAESNYEEGIYACGEFELLRDIKLVDLSSVPDVPSFFDAKLNTFRSAILFLHDFARDISRPIARDDRTHVEYVPTQVVTEYFREVFSRRFFPVDGIRYRSAPRPTHNSIVLFADNRDIEGPKVDEHTPGTRLRLKAREGSPCRSPLLRLVGRSELVFPSTRRLRRWNRWATRFWRALTT